MKSRLFYTIIIAFAMLTTENEMKSQEMEEIMEMMKRGEDNNNPE